MPAFAPDTWKGLGMGWWSGCVLKGTQLSVGGRMPLSVAGVALGPLQAPLLADRELKRVRESELVKRFNLRMILTITSPGRPAGWKPFASCSTKLFS